jgi:hypothetical protein
MRWAEQFANTRRSKIYAEFWWEKLKLNLSLDV